MPEPEFKPRVSVILPVYNAERTLPQTLDSLERLEHDSFEVIFVDDGSTDASAQMVRARGFGLVRLARNRGAGTARNVGAHNARGEILAFTDADCVVPSDWLRDIERHLRRDDILGVSGPYGGHHSPDFASRFAFGFLEVKERDHEMLVRSCTTSNLGCRRDVFLQSGGFPVFGLGFRPHHPFQGHEESNWAYLASAALGKDLLWQPSLTVVHQFRHTVGDFLREQFFFGKVIAVSHCKYPGMLLNSRSNFNKLSTLAQVVALLVVMSLALAAGGAQIASEPVLVAAVLLSLPLALVVAVSSMNARFLRHIVAGKPGVGFLVGSIGLLQLTYLAWIAGGLFGLGLAVASGFRFPDIDDLAPHERG